MNDRELKQFAKRVVRGITSLRVEAGDILLVKDYETMGVLTGINLPGCPPCTILFAPHGIEKVSLASLKSMVAAIEKQDLDIAAQKQAKLDSLVRTPKEPTNAPPAVN